MAIDHREMQLACRTQLLTLSVATTGAISMSASGTTITRGSGSFLTDGFAAGMEITGSGFSEGGNNAVRTLVAVAALTLTVDRALSTEGAAGGKTVEVALPSRRAWENVEFDPDQGHPWVEEEYLPGPASQISVGPGGTLEGLPLYLVNVHVPSGVGAEASNGYADALLSLFAPRTVMTLTNGDKLRVRADPGPYREQLLQRRPGWATVPVTIPMRVHTINP